MAGEGANIYGFWPADPNAPIKYYPVAATQTFAAGDPVIESTGVAVAVAASSATLLGVAAGPCAALATSTMVPVWSDPETVFRARIAATAASLVPGDLIDLTGTTGAFTANPALSTQDLFVFLRTVPGQTNSTVGALIEIKINPHNHQLHN